MANTAKKYYWLKLKEDFFEDDTIEWIEEQPGGERYSLFYLKLCLKSLKTDGILIRNVGDMLIPYDVKKLAEITKTDVDTVRVAMEIFKKIGLVQILENGEIYMAQLQNMVGSETSKAQLMRNKRARDKENALPAPKNEEGNIVTDALPNRYTEIEIEKETDKELDKEKETEKENIDYSRIINTYNDICISFPRLRTLSDTRKKAIKARINSGYTYEDFETMFIKAEASTFLKGGNDRDWSATFDWMLKDANMAKILDGNYDNKKVATPKNQQKSSNPFLNRLKEMGEV